MVHSIARLPKKSPVSVGFSPAVRSGKACEEADHDAVLVRRFNAGDDPAFLEIMSRYQKRMSAVAYKILRNHADAEEIAQDTFVRAYRGLARFRGDASLSTWLHRIALNLARNRYWYFFRRRQHASVSLEMPIGKDSDGTFSDLVASLAVGPVREAQAGEFSSLVETSIAGLSEESREILTLRCVLDWSYQDIACELGLSVGTVKSRISRARERLRVLMTTTCPDFGENARPTAWFESVRPAGGLEAIRA